MNELNDLTLIWPILPIIGFLGIIIAGVIK